MAYYYYIQILVLLYFFAAYYCSYSREHLFNKQEKASPKAIIGMKRGLGNHLFYLALWVMIPLSVLEGDPATTALIAYAYRQLIHVIYIQENK